MFALRVIFALYLVIESRWCYTYRFARQTGCSSGKECLPLSRCPEYKIRRIQSNITVRSHLRQNNCGFHGKESKVCCSEYTETHTCGKRDSFNSLILGGEETVPGEWPWAVILQFTDDDMRCGGVLISSRHV